MLDIEALKVIDADSHFIEPPDLWTSRLSGDRWGDGVPSVVYDEVTDQHRWKIGDILSLSVATGAQAGWGEYPPSEPKTLDEAHPACFDPYARLKVMDEHGVWGQILYPNVTAFDPGAFMSLDPALSIACISAYNDGLAEFASADPRRLGPMMTIPFWDIEASIAEMERARALGHRGLLLGCHFDRGGLPNLWEPRWEPLLAAAQDLDVSINFHIGFLGTTAMTRDLPRTRTPGVNFMSNAQAISDIITTGLAHRYPRLKFVSVESGFGYVPYLLETLDWQWMNTGDFLDHPERELPSYYFRRQFFATFWFERASAYFEDFQDNIMFETDFPHPTSLSPGPASQASCARDTIPDTLALLRPEVLRKVVHDNAARLYGFE